MALELKSKIEGLLFYKGDELTTAEIADVFKVKEEEVLDALLKLEEDLSNRGLIVVRKENKVVLGTNSELGSLIESIRKEELSKELTKASLETLSIILYKNGVTRSEIDYIRGVNSNFILRNLLVRGLIEKVTDKKDSRRILYRPTFDTLAYLGVKSIDELPNYEDTVKKLDETLNLNINQAEEKNE